MAEPPMHLAEYHALMHFHPPMNGRMRMGAFNICQPASAAQLKLCAVSCQ